MGNPRPRRRLGSIPDANLRLAARQTNGTLTTKETNGIPLATYLEQWRAHYDGPEPRFPPGMDTNKLPAFLPMLQAPTPEEIQATRERMEAARQQRRLELKGKEEYKEMFGKEEEWKEKSKAITKDMTLQEVISVMGPPTHVEKFVETSKTSAEAVTVPTNDLSSVTGMAFVYYSPDAQPPDSGVSIGEMSKRLPFDYLFLEFDKEGKLVFERWGKEAEELSLLRSVPKGVEQH